MSPSLLMISTTLVFLAMAIVVSGLYSPCECPTRDCYCLRTRNCSTVDYVPICRQAADTPVVASCGDYEQCCRVRDPLAWPAWCEDTCPEGDRVFGAYGSCGIWSEAGMSHMPWAASFIHDDGEEISPICGATIVHPRFVLTTAGCLRGTLADGSLYVVAGTDTPFQTDGDPHVQRVAVLRSLQMLHYSTRQDVSNGDFDLALLELETPLSRDPGYVDVVCLQQPDSRLDLCNCWATGISADSGLSPLATSWKTKVRVLKHKTCENLYWDLYSENYTLSQGFTCAVGGLSFCDVDYGSPVVCPLQQDALRFVLAGVVGNPLACDRPEVPTLLVNTGYFSLWIQRTLKALGYTNYAVHPIY